MKILPLFYEFVESIISFKIFDIELIDILIFFTILIFTFKIISILGNSHKNKDKKGSDKE